MANHECNELQVIHNLDNRLTRVETDVEYIRDDVGEIRGICSEVQVHLAKQNGTLPRIEEKVTKAASRLEDFSNRIVLIEKGEMVRNTLGKGVWGIIGGVLTGAVLIAIKFAFGL